LTKKTFDLPDDLLKQLDAEPFRSIDRQFARFLVDRYNADDLTAFSGALTSALLSSGHSCLLLDEDLKGFLGDRFEESFRLPSPDKWIADLEVAPCVGNPGERKPLILDGRRLYLYKYFRFETKLAERLQLMAKSGKVKVPVSVINLAAKLFHDETKDLSSYDGQLQTAAAFLPFFSRLSVISGGPGTGKTTALTKLLALLCADAMDCGESMPAIELAAPTGKAAQRMAESIRSVAAQIPQEKIAAHLAALIPKTLHRLLGLNGISPKPARNEEFPIEADVVVVDEASMMDITIFSRLVDALPDNARLVLLGDRFQLASIEAGCVMADVCDAFAPNLFAPEFVTVVNKAIKSSKNSIAKPTRTGSFSPVVELQYSYRFQEGEAIGVVSRAINSGSAENTLTALSSKHTGKSTCILVPHPGDAEMISLVHEGFKALLNANDPADALNQLGNFMVLTAVNEGRFGREGINQQLIRVLGGVVPVRPIKITENSIRQTLFNGDMGVIMRSTGPDGTVAERAWFPGPDGTPRAFLIGALPAHVDAFAITIHNSQGSEFEKIFIVLPEKDTPLMTRELLYTAVTRARKDALIFGTEPIVKAAVERRIVRHSGLGAHLAKARLEQVRSKSVND
jgi:exodeoxyribonuclease V alpha subunit